MPDQFESIYRVIGFGDEARRMGLYDIPRDDTIWVNTVGYGEEINSVLEEVQSGNLLHAEVTHSGAEDEYWNLLSVDKRHDSILYYIPTTDFVVGPIDDLWEKGQKKGIEPATAALRDDDGNVQYEIQVQPEETETNDGEVVNTYTDLQRGELLVEPLYTGEGTDFLPDGCEAILVVNPSAKPYVVMYLFPEKNKSFNNIWGEYYSAVEG